MTLVHDQEVLYCVLVEQAPDMVTLHELDGTRVYTSPACERFLGPCDDIAMAAVHPDDRHLLVDLWRKVVGGERAMAAFRHRDRDGGQVWLETSACLATYREVPHVLAITRDISDRVHAEEVQRARVARFRAFLDHATDAVFLIDAAATIIDVNREACDRLGYTRDELIGMTPFQYDIDATPEGFEFIERRLARGEMVVFESRHRRKDGSVFPVEVRLRPFEMDGQRNVIALVRDLTAHKAVQREVSELEAQFRAAELLERARRDRDRKG